MSLEQTLDGVIYSQKMWRSGDGARSNRNNKKGVKKPVELFGGNGDTNKQHSQVDRRLCKFLMSVSECYLSNSLFDKREFSFQRQLYE